MIVKFASMLEASGHLSRDEAAVATALAERRDTVILAAYTLAAAAQDAGYLAALIRKVARDYLTKRTDATESFDGPRDHDVAGRLLHAVDELFVTDQLSVPQCRYLQSLVLLKNPVVFAAFEVYAQDGALSRLLRVAERAAALRTKPRLRRRRHPRRKNRRRRKKKLKRTNRCALPSAICRRSTTC